MSKVAIVNSNTSKFRKETSSLLEVSCEPCVEMLRENPMYKKYIDGIILSTTSNVQYGAAIISEYLDIKPKICQGVDNLCSSGTNAILTGYSLIKSGLCNTILIIGADDESTSGSKLEWDLSRGNFAFPVHWAALFAKKHMRQFGTSEEQIALIASRNRSNAIKNPSALFRKKITLNDVMESKMIVEPIKLLECSYVCTGASALIITSEENAKKFTDLPVWISGIGSFTSTASFGNLSKNLSSIVSTQLAAKMAYTSSKFTPKDIDVVELHDAFSIMELLAYEDLNLTTKGTGGNYAEHTEKIINPRGGLLGSGHPLGATGVAQTAEVFNQIVGKAGRRQARSCNIGLVHNMAAAGSSSTVLILSR